MSTAAHTPGWPLFQNFYISNARFPLRRLVIRMTTSRPKTYQRTYCQLSSAPFLAEMQPLSSSALPPCTSGRSFSALPHPNQTAITLQLLIQNCNSSTMLYAQASSTTMLGGQNRDSSSGVLLCRSLYWWRPCYRLVGSPLCGLRRAHPDRCHHFHFVDLKYADVMDKAS